MNYIKSVEMLIIILINENKVKIFLMEFVKDIKNGDK